VGEIEANLFSVEKILNMHAAGENDEVRRRRRSSVWWFFVVEEKVVVVVIVVAVVVVGLREFLVCMSLFEVVVLIEGSS